MYVQTGLHLILAARNFCMLAKDLCLVAALLFFSFYFECKNATAPNGCVHIYNLLCVCMCMCIMLLLYTRRVRTKLILVNNSIFTIFWKIWLPWSRNSKFNLESLQVTDVYRFLLFNPKLLAIQNSKKKTYSKSSEHVHIKRYVSFLHDSAKNHMMTNIQLSGID